jgi:hypothetical protein
LTAAWQPAREKMNVIAGSSPSASSFSITWARSGGPDLPGLLKPRRPRPPLSRSASRVTRISVGLMRGVSSSVMNRS